MRDVFFNTAVNFMGRNGYFKAQGMGLINLDFKQCLDIAPITSRGGYGNCSVQIPYENLPDLIEALQEINAECNG